MKSDRELLELAAKAAGYKFKWFKVKQWKEMKSKIGPYRYCTGTVEVYGHHHSKPWNPKVDDGDALRLSVQLDMCIEVNRVDEVVTVTGGYRGDYRAVEMFGDCMFAATRLAIVRAAASIGEAMS